ncbi:MAG: ABC transporter permease, partial [Alistipes sp.]|nr:ABC transporter permease [Alistipes sp.]
MNTLNYSFRYLSNRRGNTLARFVSLSLGLFVALLIFAKVGYHLSYDRWIPDYKRIYTLGESHNNEPRIDYRVRYPIYEKIVSENPLFEAATVTEYYNSKMSYENREAVEMHLGEVSNTFFDVFDLKIISGDPHKILSTPDAAMISDSGAKKLFGDEDPLGKTVQIYNIDGDKVAKEVTIQGVYSNWDSKPTHISVLNIADLLLAFRPEEQGLSHSEYKWQLSFETYVKLRKGANEADVVNNLEGIAERAGAPEKYLQSDENYKTKYHIVPIREMYWYDSNTTMVALMSGIAILALVVACLNYILLSISSLAERSRTIAMLRCHGAQKSDIFRLFLVETLLITGSATLWTSFMIWCLEKEILHLIGWSLQKMFAFNLLWIPVVVCCAAFLLAGIIPAWLFSRVKLETAFRGGGESYRFWKRALLFVQMGCTVAVLIFMIICIRQTQYRRNMDYGYHIENIYDVHLYPPEEERNNNNYNLPSCDAVLSEIKRFPFVEATSIGVNPLDYGTTQAFVETADEQRKPLFHYMDLQWHVGFAEFLGVGLVDGRYLSEEDGRDKCLVNKLFVERMGWTDSAIGKYVRTWGGIYQVVGVVEDIMSAMEGTVVPTVIHKYTEYTLSKTYTVAMRFSTKATDEEREQVLAMLKNMTG